MEDTIDKRYLRVSFYIDAAIADMRLEDSSLSRNKLSVSWEDFAIFVVAQTLG